MIETWIQTGMVIESIYFRWAVLPFTPEGELTHARLDIAAYGNAESRTYASLLIYLAGYDGSRQLSVRWGR